MSTTHEITLELNTTSAVAPQQWDVESYWILTMMPSLGWLCSVSIVSAGWIVFMEGEGGGGHIYCMYVLRGKGHPSSGKFLKGIAWPTGFFLDLQVCQYGSKYRNSKWQHTTVQSCAKHDKSNSLWKQLSCLCVTRGTRCNSSVYKLLVVMDEYDMSHCTTHSWTNSTCWSEFPVVVMTNTNISNWTNFESDSTQWRQIPEARSTVKKGPMIN